jgi:hypothetical protein
MLDARVMAVVITPLFGKSRQEWISGK